MMLVLAHRIRIIPPIKAKVMKVVRNCRGEIEPSVVLVNEEKVKIKIIWKIRRSTLLNNLSVRKLGLKIVFGFKNELSYLEKIFH